MQRWQILQWSASLTYLLGLFAFGGIVGSFINVVVYRLPRGLNIVVPPSACPQCETKLSWRENVPIFGWLWLGGRCRFCKSKISPEYPLVELTVALLFSLLFALWLMHPSVLRLIGIDVDYWKPEWAQAGMAQMWPMFLAMLALAGSFVCATIVDAKTFTIPLAIPWFATAVGLIVHPLHAAFISRSGPPPYFPPHAPLHDWTIPLPDAPFLGLALGGTLGIAIAIGLLRAGLLPLSFADYEEWEEAHTKREEASGDPVPPESSVSESGTISVQRIFLVSAPGLTLMVLGWAIGLQTNMARPLLLVGLGLGLVIGLVLSRLAGGADENDPASQEPIWNLYPHTRREMMKEILFILPSLGLGALGYWLCGPGGALGSHASAAPLWLQALGGALLGYLVGGGSIWATRILGSLAFGKEAMGLGDVHLMAAAGAILGWIDPLLAFFIAPFMALAWFTLGMLLGGIFKRAGTALPYGPHLAAATLGVVIFKPWVEIGLSALLKQPVNIP